MRCLNVTGSRSEGIVPPKNRNAAGFYLLLLDQFILTSILKANFLAQTISKTNREC